VLWNLNKDKKKSKHDMVIFNKKYYNDYREDPHQGVYESSKPEKKVKRDK
jgi:hypothetical protein